MDSDEEDEESNDVVDGVRAAWLLVERILAEDKGKYLVKWKKLPYDEATWEKASALFTDDDRAQIQRYKEHTKRYKLKSGASAPKSAAARAGGGGGRGGGGGAGGGGRTLGRRRGRDGGGTRGVVKSPETYNRALLKSPIDDLNPNP